MSIPSLAAARPASVAYRQGADDDVSATSSQTGRNSRYVALYWYDVILRQRFTSALLADRSRRSVFDCFQSYYLIALLFL